MEFYWHPPKEKKTFQNPKRKINKSHCQAAYDDRKRVSRWEFNDIHEEWQCIVTGYDGNRLVTFVYAERNDQNEIITAWRSSGEETQEYNTGLYY